VREEQSANAPLPRIVQVCGNTTFVRFEQLAKQAALYPGIFDIYPRFVTSVKLLQF